MTLRPVLDVDAVPLVRHRPRAVEPRGLRREDAAKYVGVSTSKFDDWVSRGIMPAPKKQDEVTVWDRHALDEAFDSLPDRQAPARSSPFKDPRV